MKTALVISSSVAASHVGATASAFCLRRLGIRTFVIPTTILGRHPGWGEPGGQALSAAHIASVWAGIKAQDITIDGVMTGYMGADDHVGLAAQIIQDVKASNPDAAILIDPVMGDKGRLYIPESRAQAIAAQLVPLADIITPNLWELSFLTHGTANSTAELHEICHAVKVLPCDSLITSVTREDEIGALLSHAGEQQATFHDKFETVPHGGGDALAATFLAHILSGLSYKDSFAKSVASIFAILSSYSVSGVDELALIDAQDELINAAPLALEIL